MNEKKCLLKEIKYIILCLVPVPLVKKLRFLRFRFRFHNTASKASIPKLSDKVGRPLTKPETRLACLNEKSQKLKTLTESSKSSKASIPKLSDKVRRPLTKPQ